MKNKYTSATILMILLLTSGCITLGFETQVNQENSVEIKFETPLSSETAQPGTAEATAEPITLDIDCTGTSPGETITVLHHWTGEEEERFNTILKPLVDQCGLTIVPQILIIDDSLQDASELEQKIAAASPDIIFWPWIDAIKTYRNQLYDMRQLGAKTENYANSWRELGMIDGHWLALPVKVGVKSLIWYSPQRFQTLGYQVPTTLDELTALVEKMASDANIPWSMGLESGGPSGWLGTDFIQDLLLTQQGPQYVRDMISGKVRYDDVAVVRAYQIYSQWASDPKYTPGGSAGTLNTSFYDAISQVFSDQPEAMMVRQGDWVNDYVESQWPGYQYETDYAFFVFPGIQGLQGGVDYAMVFHDTLATRALIGYLTSAAGAKAWAESKFGISPNKLAVNQYKDIHLAKVAEIVSRASTFTPDLGDTIAGPFKQAEWAAIVGVIGGADIATELSAVAATRQTNLQVTPLLTSLLPTQARKPNH